MYGTNTNTYTVVDIRKTFENCEADIRTIARRTNKWSMGDVDDILHDIIKLAENGYLKTVSIAPLQNSNDYVIRATKFSINENGSTSNSDRPGQNNDWENKDNTRLTVIISYTSDWFALTEAEKSNFQKNNNFKVNWGTSSIDTSFSHLSSGNAQLYANKGYELQKTNFK